jgi:tellurite resistance protein TehA-like permease
MSLIPLSNKHTEIHLRMWMGDALLSVAAAFFLPFVFIKRKEDRELSTYTALDLFSVIAAVVASAVGGTVAGALPNPQYALGTLIASYALWGIGLPAAMMIMVIYFQRLAIHKLPPREVIVSVFLPLGPLGFGGFGVMQLGKVAMDIFPKTHTIHEFAGVILYSLGIFIALVFWGFALLWLFSAVATIYHTRRIPFNMGWWGYVQSLNGSLSIADGQDSLSRWAPLRSPATSWG